MKRSLGLLSEYANREKEDFTEGIDTPGKAFAIGDREISHQKKESIP